jgi:hypothetical protein
MQNIVHLYNEFGVYISGGLLLLVLILFIVIIVNRKSIKRIENRLKKLTRGIDNVNIEELVKSYMDRVESSASETKEVKKLYLDIQGKVNQCIQNVSIIRYKAFEDVGSDLSFSIAMLDNNKDGFVITSIYGRNESTTYAKPIDKGISRYDVSIEEETVLKNAINKIL